MTVHRPSRATRLALPLLVVGAAHAAFTNSEVPAFRGQANTEFAGWEVFTDPFPGDNQPDDPATTADDAVIAQTTPGALITSTGNIYNPAGAPHFVVSDNVPGDLQEVVLQVATQGTPLDYGSFVLTFAASDGSTQQLVPASTSTLWNTGGTVEDRFDWDLSGVSDEILAYTIDFEAAGPHLSLDAVLLDTRFEARRPITLGTSYCTANANSTGLPSSIAAFGSDVAGDNNLALTCVDIPLNRFGYFLASENQGFFTHPGGSQGNLCLAQPIGRFATQVQNSGTSGSIGIAVDLTDVPLLGAARSGETWNFQCWYRDVGSASNFSDGVSIAFQ